MIACGAVARLGWRKGLISLVPSVLSLGCGLAVLAMSGQAVNLFSLLALVLVLGIGINYTLFFSNPRGTPLTSLLAIALAMLTTLLTLGMLVFSATQAISSFGIVLVSGIFTAFLLSPLAMPDKKSRLQSFAAGVARPPAGVAATWHAHHAAGTRDFTRSQFAATVDRQLQRQNPVAVSDA